MIGELLKAKKISPEEHDLYMLYQASELGRKCLDRMMHDTFMDEPGAKDFTGVGFAFFDGRRSVFRDVHRVIQKVTNFIKESKDEPRKPTRKPR